MPRVTSAEYSSSTASTASPPKTHAKIKGTAASRRRRRVAPPKRLAWPGQTATSGSSLSQNSTESKSQQHGKSDQSDKHKRSDQASKVAPSNRNKGKSKQQQHHDFFQPRRLPRVTNASSPTPGRKRNATSMSSSALLSAARASQGTSPSNDLWVDKHAPTQTSELVVAPKKVKEVSAWLREQQQQSDHAGLLILVGSPGVGKSTLVKLLARESDLDVLEWSESFYQYDATAAQNGGFESLSPLRHWKQFLQQNSLGYQSLVPDEDNDDAAMAVPAKRKLGSSFTDTQQQSSGPKRLILLDELPYCHTREMKDDLKEALTQHVHNSKVPTILVWSHNVLEGKHNPADLENMVERDTLYSNFVTIMTINPATVARFQSTLTRISKKEGISLTKEAMQELHVRSGGDIRFALQTLQFEKGASLSSNSRTKRSRSDNDVEPAVQQQRDVRLSTFHALGKVLYAKRKKELNGSGSHNEDFDKDAPLDFDPDKAMEHSGMELGGSIHFLQCHSLDFFTDVSEVSTAWELYSDAALLLDMDTAMSKKGPLNDAAASLAGRAVAYANLHPAPTKFRQFSKPKSFEAMSIRKTNQWRLDQHTCGQLTRFFHSREAFATDIYPYARQFEEKSTGTRLAEGSFWNSLPLQSFLAPSQGAAYTSSKQDDEIDETLRKEQEEVLQEDDISDFD